jgi:ADP-heptose:LPS heptosyltransferase
VAKFLILRFSSIGDIILTTPVIRCLHEQVNNVEIHYATKKSFSPVIEHNPHIHKKKFLENDMGSFMQSLKQEKYDYIIDLHNNIRTYSIKLKLGVKSFSFNKLNFEKWLLVNFKINRLPKLHIVDRYLETVKSFGVINDAKGLDYFLSESDELALQQLPATHASGYLGFVIGARHFTKQLPSEKIISICKKITQPIVLLGGKEDFEKGQKIISEAGPNVFNACGKFSINESAALVKNAFKIISHDTGLMHIAAAYKKEIISVWGNTVPEFGMAPYFGNAEIKNQKSEVRNLYCRPCTKIGYDKCPQGHFRCMKEIDEDKIINFLS